MTRSKNDSLSIDDIGLIDCANEATYERFVKFVQCTINAFQRQGFVNLKMLADSGKSPIKELAQDPTIFTKGYSARFIYQNSAILAPLTFRDEYLKKHHPESSTFTTSFFTAITEAAIGAPIELLSLKDSLKKTGTEISSPKHFAATSSLLFFPFAVRNYFAWLVVNSDEKNLENRATLGGLAGIASGVADSFANQVMKINPLSRSIAETYAKALQELHLNTVITAAPYRGAGGMFAATILSPQFRDLVKDVIEPLFQKIESRKTEAESDTPNSSASNTSNPQTLTKRNPYRDEGR